MELQTDCTEKEAKRIWAGRRKNEFCATTNNITVGVKRNGRDLRSACCAKPHDNCCVLLSAFENLNLQNDPYIDLNF